MVFFPHLLRQVVHLLHRDRISRGATWLDDGLRRPFMLMAKYWPRLQRAGGDDGHDADRISVIMAP